MCIQWCIGGGRSQVVVFECKHKDEDGNKTSEVNGIRAACKIMKTRYAKPFESLQIKIPYDTGMNPYSGLVDMFEAMGLLVQQGNRLKWVHPVTQEEVLLYRKEWKDDKLDMILENFHITPKKEETLEEIEENVE